MDSTKQRLVQSKNGKKDETGLKPVSETLG